MSELYTPRMIKTSEGLYEYRVSMDIGELNLRLHSCRIFGCWPKIILDMRSQEFVINMPREIGEWYLARAATEGENSPAAELERPRPRRPSFGRVRHKGESK